MSWRAWKDVWNGHRRAPRWAEVVVVAVVDAVVWTRATWREWAEAVPAWVESGRVTRGDWRDVTEGGAE